MMMRMTMEKMERKKMIMMMKKSQHLLKRMERVQLVRGKEMEVMMKKVENPKVKERSENCVILLYN
jgi:hypothetical protein